MTNRWIIRGFFMLPILLCVGGWVRSYWYAVQVGYDTPQMERSLDMGKGEVYVYQMTLGNVTRPSEWHFRWWERPYHPYSTFTGANDTYVFGFGWGSRWYGSSEILHFAVVPFWFPTVLTTLLLLFVWRKTLPAKPGRAFPVEMTAREKQV